jgi:adenosylmethionine-8-amino-7-oxononanoate aminotransferase
MFKKALRLQTTDHYALCFTRTGSEAMEAAMKLARQYFLELLTPQPQRTRFIARKQSYHGTTLGSLSMGAHVARRELFEPMLLPNISHVSPCYPYRGRRDGESDADYVARLAEELDAEFQRLGPETVCAFVAEPVVGAVCTLPYLSSIRVENSIVMATLVPSNGS